MPTTQIVPEGPERLPPVKSGAIRILALFCRPCGRTITCLKFAIQAKTNKVAARRTALELMPFLLVIL
jgi:hypothetical protein